MIDQIAIAGYRSIRSLVLRLDQLNVVTGQSPVQGTLRRKPVSLQLGFTSNEFSYCLDLGLPQRSESEFSRDPELKR